MTSTRIDPKDAAFVYQSRPGNATDHYLTTVLAHEPGAIEVTGPAIAAEIARRVRATACLHGRLSEPALHLDYPRWVRRTAPFERDIVEHAVPGGTWQDALDVLGSIVAEPLDPASSSWRVHLLVGVSGAPGADAATPVTIAVVQIAHWLADGAGAVAITRTLLGDDTVGDALPAPRLAQRRVPGASALLGAARVPIQIGGIAWSVARSLRSSRALKAEIASGAVPGAPAPRTATVINVPPGPARSTHILVRPRAAVTAVDGTRVSVTTGVLIAVGEALTAFLAEQGHHVPPDLGAHVPVALPDTAAWSGVNRLAAATVGLHPEISDRIARAEVLADELAAERRRATHQAVLDSVRVADHLPAAVLRWGTLRGEHAQVPDARVSDAPTSTPVVAHTIVSSVRSGPDDLGVAGTRSLYMTGFASLSSVNCLNHTVFGHGDTIAVGVLVSPTAVPDHRRYVELLSDALDRST